MLIAGEDDFFLWGSMDFFGLLDISSFVVEFFLKRLLKELLIVLNWSESLKLFSVLMFILLLRMLGCSFLLLLEEVAVFNGFFVFLFRPDLDFIVRTLRPEVEMPLFSEAYVSWDFGSIFI